MAMDHQENFIADTVREVVDAIDTEILALVNLSEVAPSRELSLAMTKFQEGRMWLKQIGHAGQFDTPQGEI